MGMELRGVLVPEIEATAGTPLKPDPVASHPFRLGPALDHEPTDEDCDTLKATARTLMTRLATRGLSPSDNLAYYYRVLEAFGLDLTMAALEVEAGVEIMTEPTRGST